jgi:hypothetical protein
LVPPGVEASLTNYRKASDPTPTSKSKKAAGDADKVAEYEVDGLDAYTRNGFEYPPKFSAEFTLKTANLTRRSQEQLWYDELVHGPASALEDLHVRDLLHSWSFGSISKNRTATVVSGSMLWVRGTYTTRSEIDYQSKVLVVVPGRKVVVDRMLTGEEHLAVQGFDVQRQDLGGCFSFKELVDLAGNSFAGGVVIAVLHSMFTKLRIVETLLIDSVVEVESASGESEGSFIESGESEVQQDCTLYSDAASSLACPRLFAHICSSRRSMHLLEWRTWTWSSSTMATRTCSTSTIDRRTQTRVLIHLLDFSFGSHRLICWPKLGKGFLGRCQSGFITITLFPFITFPSLHSNR